MWLFTSSKPHSYFSKEPDVITKIEHVNPLSLQEQTLTNYLLQIIQLKDISKMKRLIPEDSPGVLKKKEKFRQALDDAKAMGIPIFNSIYEIIKVYPQKDRVRNFYRWCADYIKDEPELLCLMSVDTNSNFFQTHMTNALNWRRMVRARPQILFDLIDKVSSNPPEERAVQWKTLYDCTYIFYYGSRSIEGTILDFPNPNYEDVIKSEQRKFYEIWMSIKKKENQRLRTPKSATQIMREIDEEWIDKLFKCVYVAVQFGYVKHAESLLMSDKASMNEFVLSKMYKNSNDVLNYMKVVDLLVFRFYNKINHPFIEALKKSFETQDEEQQLRSFTNAFGKKTEIEYMPYHFGEKEIKTIYFGNTAAYNVMTPDVDNWLGRFKFARSLLDVVGSEMVLI